MGRLSYFCRSYPGVSAWSSRVALLTRTESVCLLKNKTTRAQQETILSTIGMCTCDNHVVQKQINSIQSSKSSEVQTLQQFCTTRDIIEWAWAQFCTISKWSIARHLVECLAAWVSAKRESYTPFLVVYNLLFVRCPPFIVNVHNTSVSCGGA